MNLRKDPESEDTVNNIKLKEKRGNKDFATSFYLSLFFNVCSWSMWLLNGSYILTKILEDISFLFYYFDVSLFSSLYPFVSSVPCNVSPSRSRRFFSHPLSPLATFSPGSSLSIRASLISVSVTGLSLCFAKLAGKVSRENSTETKAVKKGISYYFFFFFFSFLCFSNSPPATTFSSRLEIGGSSTSIASKFISRLWKNDPVAFSAADRIKATPRLSGCSSFARERFSRYSARPPNLEFRGKRGSH